LRLNKLGFFVVLGNSSGCNFFEVIFESEYFTFQIESGKNRSWFHECGKGG
jgi:hypothetical protein